MLTAVKQNSFETGYDSLVRGFQCSTGFSIDLVFCFFLFFCFFVLHCLIESFKLTGPQSLGDLAIELVIWIRKFLNLAYSGK